MVLCTVTCSYPEASFSPEGHPLAGATLPPAWLQGLKEAVLVFGGLFPSLSPSQQDTELSLTQQSAPPLPLPVLNQ